MLSPLRGSALGQSIFVAGDFVNASLLSKSPQSIVLIITEFHLGYSVYKRHVQFVSHIGCFSLFFGSNLLFGMHR